VPQSTRRDSWPQILTYFEEHLAAAEVTEEAP